ncbi:hypothetical protein [Tannerella forsythia]|uniref:DUF4412 domain-containing protein n=1 Tax=Tannerella forsythia TaxID=28112 RepID=A0A3P1XPL0_TANFO|nr:hypothetical protein [Tannerella forsythia]RRD60008.1 hypothetical protein EII40_08345 [Tannerella forsythia]
MKKTWFVMMLLIAAVGMITAQEAKYEIKSGIVKKVSNVMGQKVESILYFDDYGKMEAVETTVNVAGTEKNMRTLDEGNSIASIDLDAKTVQRMEKPDKLNNFLTLTDEQKEKYKYQELGEETFLDRPCKKISLELTEMGQTFQATLWLWRGIPLKTETQVGGMTVVEEAVEVQENVEVPAEKFTVPEGFTVSE